MNRAQRRNLKATVKRMVKGGGLAHPVPGSVVLRGGPMDGWITKPDAPALQPDWRAKYLEAEAIGLHALTLFGTSADPRWSELTPEEQQPFRDAAKFQQGAGHYELRGKGQAEWVVEG